MGCVVNGPGEAREVDLGIAGGKGFLCSVRKNSEKNTPDKIVMN